MPLDVFAALGALVRAEAVRTKKVPAPTPAEEPATPQPDSQAPPPAEPPEAVAAEPPQAVTAVPRPARRGLLARLVQKLTTLFG
ncbi:hypothetical protein [Streptomyces caniferus]|uniref:hypothetical protein n=1 Tax=Streptomyces caniferus TaxID=285557 RepID=UPI00381EA96E